MFLALGIALLLALAIGLINGLATLLLSIPSFIITLATALFWAGVSLNLTGGYPISYFGDSPVMSWLGTAEIGHSKISVSILWLLIFALILAVVLRTTAVGNWIFASGGDSRAARAMGVPVGAVNHEVAALARSWCDVVQAYRDVLAGAESPGTQGRRGALDLPSWHRRRRCGRGCCRRCCASGGRCSATAFRGGATFHDKPDEDHRPNEPKPDERLHPRYPLSQLVEVP